MEDVLQAYKRVEHLIEAQDPNDLTAQNVDVVAASSLILGVADNILIYRDRMEKLPEFDIRHVDFLKDLAKALWFLSVTNLPVLEPADAPALVEEVSALRTKLILWARPLAASEKLSQKALDKVLEGNNTTLDKAGDVVALVSMYRADWDSVKDMCGVTVDDLDRGALIGPAVFAWASRRENDPVKPMSSASLQVRKAWTLLDRAYAQCRRGIGYFRFDEGDADTIAPNVRRNAGARNVSRPEPQPEQPEQPVAPTPESPVSPAEPAVGPGDPPFVNR
jgi:hypothetical protein